MRLSPVSAGLLLLVISRPSGGIAADDPTPAERVATARRFGLDPASPPESRVSETPPDVLKMFADGGMTEVRAHVLTDGEHRQLKAAFEALPPLHRRILGERLRSLSFLDGMPNTALTSSVNGDEPYRLFHFTIRAGIFREDVSEWTTKKERTYYDASGSSLSVSVDAGRIDSIVYVLLHEATHVVDAALRITPDWAPEVQPPGEVAPTEFTRGVWSQLTLPAPPYRDPLMQGLVVNQGGHVVPIAKAESLYDALRRTPFASLYGSHAWTDDLAEYVAIYHWTEVLRQPYRITIRDGGREVFAYEPMKSALVRGRFGQMRRFYE